MKKKLVFIVLNFLFINSIYSQDSTILDKIFPTDSMYMKNLDTHLNSAIQSSNFKPLYVQDLQEKYAQLGIGKSIKMSSSESKLIKVDSKNLYNERKKAVWIISKFFSSTFDTVKTSFPIATAYSVNNSGICISNFHVFAEVFFPMRSRMTHKIQVDSSLYFVQNIDGKIYFIDSILSIDPINDITIFHIKTNKEKLPFIPIATENNVGETVYIISHPDNNFYYLSKGIINRKYRENANYKLEGPFHKYIMDVSADYAIGSSGRPIMNEKGELVGMVSSTNVIKTNPGSQPQQQMVLKKSIPLEVIRKILF